MGALHSLHLDENEGDGQNVTIDGTVGGNRSAQLVPGRYVIYSKVDCYFRRGGSAVTVDADDTAGTGKTNHYLPAGTFFYFVVREDQKSGGGNTYAKDYLAVIRDSVDGILRIRRAAV